jgi:hypothetical protein
MAFVLCTDAFAKKDFKGLFGSYRREKFTENAANSTDFGVDLLLSTAFPLTDMVKSQELAGANPASLNYSVFYNVEASAWLSLAYHWVLFANVGWYNYDSRKENALTRDNPANTTTPIFHQFEMESIPVVGGIRYRFLRDDIVPYLGVGAGMAYTRRKGFYDNDPTQSYAHQEHRTVLVGQVQLGLEFYFATYAGLRIEAAAYYFNLPAVASRSSASNVSLPLQPILTYQSNPWLVRYASGVFFLF